MYSFANLQKNMNEITQGTGLSTSQHTIAITKRAVHFIMTLS